MKTKVEEIFSLCSSDDEDVPLKKTKLDNDEETSTNLETLNPQEQDVHCEFCDKTFSNRYSAMIHNVNHIIIPLLNQTFYQCPDCLYHFNSLEHLSHHISKKHLLKLKNDIECSKNQIAINYDNKTIEEKPFNNNQNCLIISEKVEIENGKEHENVFKIDNELMKNESNKIIRRIKFEDDYEDDLQPDGLLNDLTIDCKVNLELFEAPNWLFPRKETEDVVENFREDEIVDVDKIDVHFEELMQPEIQWCRFCRMTFPNRYELIIHESSHMKMDKKRLYLCAICERFIAGELQGLKNHKLQKHHGFAPQPTTLRYCDKCNLRYNSYPKHVINYHKIYVCRICTQRFEKEEERDKHMDIHLNDTHCSKCNFTSTSYEVEEHEKKCERNSVKKVCELCSMFYKNRHNITYIYKGDLSETGVRQVCDSCGHKFFELKILEVFNNNKHALHDKERKCTKPLSNKDRLKNIHNRLKKLSKLNKFYFFCFIFEF